MKSGFTQEMVAEKINVSRQTISNWENEKSYPDIISVIELSSLYLMKLLAILNISVSEWNSCENIKQEEVL